MTMPVPGPTYSDNAVKHYGLVVWAENSKGTKYQRCSSNFDGNVVTTSFQVENKKLSFRLGWRSSTNAPISAYCKVTISPSVNKDGCRIPERRFHRLMDKNIWMSQTCHTTSNTDLFTRRYHPIFRQAPKSDDAHKLISVCLEIRLLRQDITEGGIRDLREALQVANDGGADLEDEIIDAQCQAESPEATFQFDFFPTPRKSRSQNTDPEVLSKKRKRTPESESEEPIAHDMPAILSTANDPISGTRPAAQLMNNVEPNKLGEVEDQARSLQELTAEEKALEDELLKIMQTKRRRIEAMRKVVEEYK